ncbi:hypothetical protein JW868_01275 [Candidatus Woesearchaeota archaeon]|nr:hypothetical protein [Candidatus Woesearchaeota archaeon]
MEPTSFARQTAVKCSISDLLEGKYFVQEGFDPNFILTKYGRISRANIMGIIVAVESSNSFVLDDGTGMIPARSFEQKISIPNVGSIVNVIGRPRVFNNEIFLSFEIVKKIESSDWIDVRKKELSIRKAVARDFEGEEEGSLMTGLPKDDYHAKSDLILETIRKKDSGNGLSAADVKKNLPELAGNDVEKVIETLMRDGEIFECSPGKVKVL